MQTKDKDSLFKNEILNASKVVASSAWAETCCFLNPMPLPPGNMSEKKNNNLKPPSNKVSIILDT